MSILQTDLWDIQTSYIRCKPEFTTFTSVAEPKYKYSIKTSNRTFSDTTTTNRTKAWKDTDNCFLGYSGFVDRDPEYGVVLMTNGSADATIRKGKVANKFKSSYTLSSTGIYTDEYVIQSGYEFKDGSYGGYCLDLDSSTNIFRKSDDQNRGCFIILATVGTTKLRLYIYGPGNDKGDSCYSVLVKEVGDATSVYGPKTDGAASTIFSRILTNKTISYTDCRNEIVNLDRSISSESIEFNGQVKGCLGVLLSTGDLSTGSKTISNSSFPVLSLNTAKSSYYVTVTVSGDYVTEESTDIFVPSYRFDYDYSATSDPFAASVTYKGKFALPIANQSDTIARAVSAAYVDDRSYASKQSFLTYSAVKEWPSVTIANNQRTGDATVSSTDWFAFLDDISYLDQSGYSGDPISNQHFIRTAKLYRFVKSGTGHVNPVIGAPNSVMGGCINASPEGVDQNGKIRSNLGRNLFDIKSLSFAIDSISAGSAYYKLRWGYDSDSETTYYPASLGKIQLDRVNNTKRTYAVYDNGSTVDVSSDLLVSVKNNGNKLDKVCFINDANATFDAFTAKTSFSSFYDSNTSTVKSAIDTFFAANNKTVSGSELYFGEYGVFTEIDTPIHYDSLGGTGYAKTTPTTDGKTKYNLYDTIDWDFSVSPKLSQTVLDRLAAMGLSSVDLEIPSSLDTGWYLWIDKKENSTINPNIKLEILDCVGLCNNGEWVKYNIPDVTEVAKDSSGAYTDPDARNIPEIFERSSLSFKRIKVRFRLYCAGNDVPLNKDGYRVMLGYSIRSKATEQGEIKNFKVYWNNINPILDKCDVVKYNTINDSGEIITVTVPGPRTYICSVNNRTDYDYSVYGRVYGKSLQSVNSGVITAIRANDERKITKIIESWFDTETTKQIWQVDSTETSANAIASISQPGSTANEKLYYIKTSWNEEDISITDTIVCDVHRSVGVYFKSKAASNFDFSIGNNAFDFYDSIGWDDTEKYYCEVTDANLSSLDVAKAKYSSSRKDTSISIFDIDTSMGADEVALWVSGNITEDDRFGIRVGSMDANDIVFTHDSSKSKIAIDKKSMFADDNGDLYTRIIITKDGDVSNEIPLMYTLVNANTSGIVTIEPAYYEATGGVMVKFRDYKPLAITTEPAITPDITEITYPDGTHPEFYILNGHKNLSARVTCTLNSVSTDPNNNINLVGTTTNWKAEASQILSLTESKKLWTSPDGDLVSYNANNAVLKLISNNNGTQPYTLKYNTMNNRINMTGEIEYTYDIKIGGLVRKRVISEDKIKIGQDGSICFMPIHVSVEPMTYFMSNVISYSSPAILINETDNSNKIYTSLELITDVGMTFMVNDANTPMQALCLNVNSDMDIVFNVRGNLTEDWKKNDERLVYITSSNQMILHVINGSEYDENITRVLGGYKLKYPNSRESIMYSPNEWVTADNINIRFAKIMENLKYFASKTKFYLKPPSMYCGYYGDFNTIDQGTYRRVYGGFVSPSDRKIYKNYDENNSIDDDETYLKGCVSIAVSKPFVTLEEGTTCEDFQVDPDMDNNIYVCLGDKIRILTQETFTQNLVKNDIVPKRTNEFIDNVTRIFYSNDTNLLYCLSPKTHKIYIFNRYKYVGDPQNASYYGEIGGYGGAIAHTKFNHPNDMFVSNVMIDGKMTDEIWVCDGGNNVIKHYTIKGQWINTIDLSLIDYKILGVCVDYKNQVHVLTQNYVFTYKNTGEIIRIFELKSNGQVPLMIRPQYKAGFLYVLYEHRISKYSFDGYFIGDFAENDQLTYTCICPTKEHDIYVGTTKNILQYSDKLRIVKIGATDNADEFFWHKNEIYLNRQENIQDTVLNTSLQRMYDNIMMYSICTFGKILDAVSDDQESLVTDFDKSTLDNIIDSYHKDRVFVGINELVTLDVLNRAFNQMYDLLELMLKSI